MVERRFDADNRTVFESYPQRDIAAVDGALPGTTSVFDALGRHVQKRQSSELGDLVTNTAYLSGFQRQVTNPRGYVTTTAFQAFDSPSGDSITAITAPEGLTVGIVRDVFGKASSITRSGLYNGSPVSATRTYVYDLYQRLCKTLEPETGATVQAYDSAGNIAWRASGLALPSTASCDQASVPGAAMASHAYDTMNRLTATSYGDGSPGITRSYTADGLPLTVSSAGAIWTYGYNALRLTTLESLVFGGTTYNIGRVYDAHGKLSSLSYPVTGLTVAYSPNALGEPTQVGPYATGISYHPNGAVAGFTYGNGVVHSLTQNLRGLPEQWRDAAVMQDLYAYDANGNVSTITDQQEGVTTRTMGYDGLDRLTSTYAPGVWGNASYGYDPLDNLRSSVVGSRNSSHVYDPTTNRLTSLVNGSGTTNYGYDVLGNITSRGAQGFVFDRANRMAAATGKASYTYDGHGRRVRLAYADGSARLQVYSRDGRLLYGSHSSQGVTQHVYLGSRLIAEVVGGVPQYGHADALGSPVARSNSSGSVLSRTRYEPYGATAAGTNPVGVGFTGHVNDADTGLEYMQQRYYDQVAARFLSVDPIADVSPNRYRYARNNPYRYVDPDGRQEKSAEEPKTETLSLVTVTGDRRLLASGVGVLTLPTPSGSGSKLGHLALRFNPVGLFVTLMTMSSPLGDGTLKAEEANSPDITPDELRDKSQEELERQAKDKGLVRDPKRPNKWRDPVTGEERMRIDSGHVDPKTGRPYDNPRAASPHVHGYDQAGNKIRDPLAGNDPHFPIRP